MRLSPHMKQDWLITMPKSEAKNILRRSFGDTFSFFYEKEI